MIVSCLIVIGYSSYFLISQVLKYDQAAEKYESLQRTYEQRNKEQDRFDTFQQMNADYVGWIKIADTNINYPVVKGENNRFYLKHNFRKEPDFVGTIFMDYRNSAQELARHTVLYGHNMKDKSMFGSLKDYQNQNFYQKHRFIQFEFQRRTYKWEIFSIYFAHDTKLLATEFPSDKEFEAYMKKQKDKSIVSIPVKVRKNDRVLTLSTCTTDSKGKRMIVHAKLITGE